MKKQILAVAVAGAFAVPAFAAADTNVTLFGQLQTQIVHHSASGDGGAFNSGIRMHDAGGLGAPGDGAGPSRIGVMVNHDLGNGMTALLKMESNASTQNVFAATRDAYVGLDGNFGRVVIGRTQGSYSTAGKDPLNATFMQARTNNARLGGLNGYGNGSYLARGIRYSNDFGMVRLDLSVGVDNKPAFGPESTSHGFSGRLNFDVGPVDLYVAHSDFGDNTTAGAADTARTTKLGADWRSGPFRIVGEIEDFKFGETTYMEGNNFFVSGTYTMGRNDFVLNLGHQRLDSQQGVSMPDSDYAAIAVKHNFSNRVMAFAGVGYASTDNIGFNGSDLSFTGVGGGMRVSF
ncbi:porin [Thioalkalivibrio sp. ALE6]|uniref:porin n=1 Tax=Thioalkalivibrio sp. ALE6 TaxID=1266908 RepID=UPI00035F3909|nr:porin [Thioalkalivibrio sp. ALE6]